MGYSYGFNPSTGRQMLSCDACGTIGGVRKRTCTAICITENGGRLPYCPAPAYCSPCFKARGGSKVIHGAQCHEGAAAYTAECAAKAERIAGGDLPVNAAWGSWAEWVPEGKTGVLFGARTRDAQQVYALVDADEYKPGRKGYLSDYPNHVVLEGNPTLPTTKQVTFA